MNKARIPSTPSLALSAALRVDELCRRFEGAWMAGEAPSLEDYLAQVQGPEQQALLRELLGLEIDYRLRAGQTPTHEEYRARFPHAIELVDEHLRSGRRLAHSTAARAALEGNATPLRSPPMSEDRSRTTPDGNDLQGSMPAVPASLVQSQTVPETRCTVGWQKGPDSSLEAEVAFGPLPCELGGYELLAEVARGGMGVVYRARQKSLGRIVALKMILPGMLATPTAVQRFRQEAQAAARLDHSGIVPVYEVGELQGHHYYTMAFIDGSSLTRWVRARNIPPLAEALRIVRAAAEAVEHAHQRGILHRDLKPDNILLDADGRVRIADFGLSKQIGAGPADQGSERADSPANLTHSGQILGTPSYMAPEQALGKQQALGPPTDVYALGGVLYFLLTGQAPFSASSVAEMLCKVVHDVPESPRASSPSIPAAVEAVCLRCLEKDRARRYATAAELARELAALENAAHDESGAIAPLPPVSDNLPAPSRPPLVPVVPLFQPGAAPATTRRSRRGWLVAAALAVVLAGAGATTYALLGRPKAGDAERPDAAPPTRPVVIFPPGPLRRDFPVKARLVGGQVDDQGVVRIKEGEGVRVEVELGRDAHVYLWTVAADGTAMQLFPHDGERETPCKKAAPRLLPGEGYELGGVPGGREQLRVVASTVPLPPLPGQKLGSFLVFAEPQQKEALGKALRELFVRPVVKVAEHVIPYEVIPAR
jgi:serine/threonine protein kinase